MINFQTAQNNKTAFNGLELRIGNYRALPEAIITTGKHVASDTVTFVDRANNSQELFKHPFIKIVSDFYLEKLGPLIEHKDSQQIVSDIRVALNQVFGNHKDDLAKVLDEKTIDDVSFLFKNADIKYNQIDKPEQQKTLKFAFDSIKAEDVI